MGIEILAAVPRDGVLLPQCDLRRPVAVLLGGEGAGLPDSLVALAATRLTIPMQPAGRVAECRNGRSVDRLRSATAAHGRAS